MPDFYPLRVTKIQRSTRDAVIVSLAPPASVDFSFVQGQYLTFRREFDGVELRRSYSICSGVGDTSLQVGIKRVEGGAFSTWVNAGLAVGDTLEAMLPMGRFFGERPEPDAPHYLGIAAGSGITPILSIIRTELATRERAQFTLIYANRDSASIMFRDELADLKDQYLQRLNIVHILSREETDIELFGGRLNTDKLTALFAQWVNLESVDAAYLCGPEELMKVATDSLVQHGLAKEAVRYELFASAQVGRAPRKTASEAEALSDVTVELKIDGETRRFTMERGDSLLKAALANKIDAPYACGAGVCSTCMARVLEGEVDMRRNHALEDHEVEQGFVLMCQCYATSDHVSVSYDDVGH